MPLVLLELSITGTRGKAWDWHADGTYSVDIEAEAGNCTPCFPAEILCISIPYTYV